MKKKSLLFAKLKRLQMELHMSTPFALICKLLLKFVSKDSMLYQDQSHPNPLMSILEENNAVNLVGLFKVNSC